jgi:DNA-directed RNA polymerase subunit F
MSLTGLIPGAVISSLGHEQFRKVLNTLLIVEASINRVPLQALDISCRDTDPDGGVDAKVRWPSGLNHDVLKDGETVLQYKSGKISLRQIETEFRKPGVQKTLRAGGRYVLMVGHDYIEKRAAQLRQKLKSLCRNRRFPINKCEVLFGSQISRWICRHPSVIMMPELGRGYPAFVTAGRWLQSRELQNPWKPDVARTQINDQIKSFLRRETSFYVLRVEGPAGVGKTRIALESVRDNGTLESTIYTPNADETSVTQLLTLIQGDPETTGTVVVDECDRERQEILKSYADLAEGRLRILCVGPADVLFQAPVDSPNVFVLLPLSEESIREVLSESFGTLTKEVADLAVRLAGGYVKLALFVAEHLQRHKELQPAELARIDNVRTFLKRFVDPATQKALQLLSLLWRVGWEDELSDEAKALASFFKIDIDDFRAGAKTLREQGVVVPRGRYLYVSPDLLAISAAAELWDVRGADLIEVVAVLPREGPRRALLRRLASMGSQPTVSQAVEKLLGTEGLFKTLSDLDNKFRSEAFSILASALPEAAIDVLERLIERASRKELESFREGRRQVVWAIESLLRWPNTSVSAARSLLYLALSENESWGNNATGIFCEYFHIHLSRSPIPYMQRLALIDELIDQTNDPTSRLLATKAAKAGLDRFETRSGGNIDHFSGRGYPDEWRPRTYNELWEARQAVVERLERIAQGDDEAATEARNALIDGAFTLIADWMVDQTIGALKSITPRTDKERRSILDVCKRLERDVRDRFSDEQIQRLRQVANGIFDKDYFGRLKRWVGRRLHVDFDFQDPTGFGEADAMVRDLAQEGLQNGISESEITWLASPEAENVWEFGYRLGQLDDRQIFLEAIEAKSPDTVNAMLLASYINGRANVEGDEFREKFLDQLAESRPLLAFACTWRGTPSRLGLDRVLRLVDSGRIPPESLGYLAYASWTHPLSVEDVSRLVKAMIDSGTPKVRDAASSILMGLSSRHPASVEKTEASIWRLVEIQPDRSWEWQWGQLVVRIVNRDPKRVVRIVKTFFENEHFVPIQSDEAMKALQIATARDPEAAWEVIGDAMLKEDEVSMRLVISLTKWYGELIPTNMLISWAKNNQPRGPWIVSRIIVVHGSPMPERARALLLAFPSDNQVKSQFAASLQTGASVGPLSGRIGNDLTIAESWTQDPNPGIQSWARQLVKGIKARLKQMKTLEEEEEL